MHDSVGHGARSDTPALVDAAMVLAQLDQLQPLPQPIQRALTIAANGATTDAACGLLEHEPALAAWIQTDRNAPDGPEDRGISDAVDRFGSSAVCQLVLALKLAEFFDSGMGSDGAGWDVAEFWRHSYAVARLSTAVARLVDRTDVPVGRAGVAGLLHDVGKPALAALFPKGHARVMAETRETRGDITEVESRILGADHTIAGRRLAESWGWPHWLQEVIWLHHLAPDEQRARAGAELNVAVRLADTIVRERRLGDAGNHAIYTPSSVLVRQLNLDPATFETAVNTAIDEAGRFAGAFAAVSRHRQRAVVGTEGQRAHGAGASAPAGQSAGESARYLEALSTLFRRLTARSALGDVVAAIAECFASACRFERVAAFAIRERRAFADVRWSRTDGQFGGRHVVVTPELSEWADHAFSTPDRLFIRAPRSVREVAAAALDEWGTGDLWVLPIVFDERIVGGVLLMSRDGDPARLTHERDELAALLTCFGATIGRTNAQASAMRLAEELAENNRRMQRGQSDALRARTLASIADFAAGAGHELNSPLAVISGRAQMLQQIIGDAEVDRSLGLIVDKAHECSDIVRELMEFAQPRVLKPEHVTPVDLLEGLREKWLAEGVLPASRFALQIEEGLPSLMVDRDLIAVVLDELFRNALDASQANQGMIMIRAQRGVTPGLIEIIVRDTGCGMSPAIQDSAFEPFFSHRVAGRGRGLGLPRAHRIVTAHDGHIWLESHADQGTDVHVLLPAVTEPDTTASPPTD